MGLFNFKKKEEIKEEKPKAYLVKSEVLEKDLIENGLKLLKQNNLALDATEENIQVEFAYTIKIEGRGGEALFRIKKDDKAYVIALENDKLGIVGVKEENFGVVTDEQFYSSIAAKLNFWKPIDMTTYSNNPAERKNKNEEYIKSQGIACNEHLGTVESSTDVKLKSIDEICMRAIVSYIVIQIACDINNGKYEESIKYFKPALDKYDGYKYLNQKEKRVVDGTYTMQDAIDLDWEYETLWSLLYALSLVNDIKNGGDICDCNYVIGLFCKFPALEEFKSRCKLRNIEEILDTLDLYYRYHWACVEKQINSETKIGNLNPSVVVERRRGLEWLISEEQDWYNISLDT